MNDWDDDGEWQDMPIVRSSRKNDLDEEDSKRYRYKPPQRIFDEDTSTLPVTSGSSLKASTSTLGKATNATGNKLQESASGSLREKQGMDEADYTRLELDDDPEEDEVHMRTDFLFDDEKEMTPLSQMQATKTLLTEGQRIAYVGLCKLVTREMVQTLRVGSSKELSPAVESTQNWANKIMGRLYLHMEVNSSEQRMIDQLAEHGVTSMDLVPSLVTTHTVPNPEYDPEEAARQEADTDSSTSSPAPSELPLYTPADLPSFANPETSDEEGITLATPKKARPRSESPTTPTTPHAEPTEEDLTKALPSALPGVSTSLTSTDATVTLDIRWTILCDLFLALIADSVYDARSRVLLGKMADKLGLTWLDVVRFERRLTEALQIQEAVRDKEQATVIDARAKRNKRKRYAMMAAAGLGGGLVIGLSAGLLAPVIGAGIGAAFGTIGVTGTTGFLAGTGGAAVITTGGVLSGGTIASRGMGRRTANVKTFEFKPLHNNKRVSCFVTVPGFMTGMQDDVRLPFSVMDPVLGDLFSVLWEPDTILQTGSALKILTTEVLTQGLQQVLQATVLTAMLSALSWPIMLTKLAYLIDNPWSNALDRARTAGAILADVLNNRNLGVRPVSLIGFSLGARVIFYALVELARLKAYGVVQDVVLLGATVTASLKQWKEVRGVVSGRFVNGYSSSDWILGYLFRATTGGLSTVAGLRPVENIPDLENVDLTEVVHGHMAYRSSMPLILKHLGFRVTSDSFDEPEEDDAERPDREVLTQEEEERRASEREKKRNRWWNKRKKAAPGKTANGSPVLPEDKKSDGKEEYDYDTEEAPSSRGSISHEMPTPGQSTTDLTVFNPEKIREALHVIEKEREQTPTTASFPKEASTKEISPPATPAPRPASSDGIAPSASSETAPAPTFSTGPAEPGADTWTTASNLPPWNRPPMPSYLSEPHMHPFALHDNLNASTLSFGGTNGALQEEEDSLPAWNQPKPSISASNPWS